MVLVKVFISLKVVYGKDVRKYDLWQARRKHFLSGTATGEGSVGGGDPSARSAEKFFTFIFQLSTLALVAPLCFALHCQGRT